MNQEDNNLGLDPKVWAEFATWLKGQGWTVDPTPTGQKVGVGDAWYIATRKLEERNNAQIIIKGNGLVVRTDNGDTMVTVFKKQRDAKR